MSPAVVKTKPTRANRKCIECNRIVAATGLTCSTCFLFIHPKCTKLPPTELRSVSKNLSTFVCQYCTDFKCGKCSKPVYGNDNSLLFEADDCLKWFHLKCTKITLSEYEEFERSEDSPPWFCEDCLLNHFLVFMMVTWLKLCLEKIKLSRTLNKSLELLNLITTAQFVIEKSTKINSKKLYPVLHVSH